MLASKSVCFATSVVLHVFFFFIGVKTNIDGKDILRFIWIYEISSLFNIVNIDRDGGVLGGTSLGGQSQRF